MKKITLAIMILFAGTVMLTAQKMTVKQYKTQQEKVLHQAAKYGDVPVYKQALFQLIALEPGNPAWKDSLAVLYFRMGNYVQNILVTDELLKVKPDEVRYLEMQAQSYEALGDLKKSVALYEKLFAKTKDTLAVGYRLAWNQYMLKRTEEAYETLSKLKNMSVPKDLKVAVPAGQKKMQQVPFEAAYYNLLGLVTYDLHNWKMAISYFDQALKVFPDFVSAKQNKNALELMVQKLESTPKDNNQPKNQN